MKVTGPRSRSNQKALLLGRADPEKAAPLGGSAAGQGGEKNSEGPGEMKETHSTAATHAPPTSSTTASSIGGAPVC